MLPCLHAKLCTGESFHELLKVAYSRQCNKVIRIPSPREKHSQLVLVLIQSWKLSGTENQLSAYVVSGVNTISVSAVVWCGRV